MTSTIIGRAKVPAANRMHVNSGDTIPLPRVRDLFPQAVAQVDDRPNARVIPLPRSPIGAANLSGLPTAAQLETMDDVQAALALGDAQRTVDTVEAARILERALTLLQQQRSGGRLGWLRRLFPDRRLSVFAQAVRDLLAEEQRHTTPIDTRLRMLDRAADHLTECPDWCDDCLPDPDGRGNDLHGGQVGELPEGTRVCVERPDTNGRPDRAIITVYPNSGSVLELDPDDADHLIDLVAKARTVAIEDRAATGGAR